MKPPVIFPSKGGGHDLPLLTSESNFVIVGANGSGKSRLGSWIEFNQHNGTFVHRISAQRALAIPDYADLKSLTQAQQGLLYGGDFGNRTVSIHDKRAARWAQNPETSMLGDFHFLRNPQNRLFTHIFALYYQTFIFELLLPCCEEDIKFYNGQIDTYWCPPLHSDGASAKEANEINILCNPIDLSKREILKNGWGETIMPFDVQNLFASSNLPDSSTIVK